MRKTNLIGIALILFFALFSAQLVYGQMQMRNMKMGSHHKMMMKKLNLTEKQQATIEKLMISHQKQMVDLKADLEKRKLDLQELKLNTGYTRDEFLAKIGAINEAKNKIALAMANHKMDIYELLTVDQKKIFNEMGNMMENKMEMRKHEKMPRDF
ncbi:periplasmic protein [bacterium BMS3Abin03]|nr:periplasmic protein [bacterium BMS3Abin03]